MRITNAMMTNTTLMHINRNQRNLNDIIRQIETGKRVSRASDDPIIASRALKFRAGLAETVQFQRNVENGLAWMNVTESSFNNINAELLAEIRALLVQGATGTNYLSQKQTITTQMRSLFQQIGSEVNQTFAGRYLFSGLRTNEPPTFTTDNNRSFVISQHFSLADIKRATSIQRLPTPPENGQPGVVEPRTHYINVIRLAFSGLDMPDWPTPAGQPIPGSSLAALPPHYSPDTPSPIVSWAGSLPLPDFSLNIPGFDIVKISREHPQAYNPEATLSGRNYPVIHFIAETGELVMHTDVSSQFPREGISVTYQKTGFRQGDINPAVYFTSREIIDTSVPNPPVNGVAVDRVYQMTEYLSRPIAVPASAAPTPPFTFQLAYIPSFGTTATETALRPMMFGQPLPIPSMGITFNDATGEVTIPEHIFLTHSNISITYNVENPVVPTGGHIKQDTRVQGVQLVRALEATTGRPVPLDQAEVNHSFDMHNQEMINEFAPHTRLAVNSLAKNVLTDKMFADFRVFFEFADSLHVSDRNHLEEFFRDRGHTEDEIPALVEAQLTREYAMVRNALHQQFNNMLFQIDRHMEIASREQTQLGARMIRLELLQDRLDQDYVSYNRLVSNNEDTDIVRALIHRASAEATFMGSLQANAGILQMSLAQFIR